MDYEKLGAFYLGKEYDLQKGSRKDEVILYDSKDLVTHALCVGMTGSGKTGLCINLLEEAAIDGIPAVVIDPKGDIGNLLLQFPNLSAEEFLPWINEEDARKKNLDPQSYAKQQADFWRNGLAEWHQDASRIAKLQQSANFRIYTPGSSSGLPVSVLKSFVVPPKTTLDDFDAFHEKIQVTTTALLGLLGIDANPLQSREHILLATILETAWKQNQDLDLAALIQWIQNPPIQKVGVMDLETFYPAKDRFGLAMTINNLLAAPGFSAWMNGEDLNFGNFLYTPKGKPVISIFSIAHLSDAERMFFVSLLLSEALGWMRTQSGTTSLRAILYMDEIFGYFPPVSNPPSKPPLLALLKQARAFGLGIMLATQNPVDLDYKGLSNCGTWFLGRLQTERDKERVLEGLEGASANFKMHFYKQAMSEILAGLKSRVFLMNNVHEDSPLLLETRWCLSYLRGPLTKDQIKKLMDPVRPVQAKPAEKPTETVVQENAVSNRPVMAPEIPQYFLPIRGIQQPNSFIHYKPYIYGSAKVFYLDGKIGVSSEQEIIRAVPLDDKNSIVDWQSSVEMSVPEAELDRFPAEEATWGGFQPDTLKAKNFERWKKAFVDWVFRTQKVDLMSSQTTNMVSQPNELERDFRIRIRQAFQEKRDREVEKLRRAYGPKIQMIQERIRRAEQTVDREQQQARDAKMQTAISFGTTVLGALFGRKKLSTGTLGRATTAARGVSRSMKESEDINRAEETVGSLRQKLADLEKELQDQISNLELTMDPQYEALQTMELRPKKTNINVRLVAVVWEPNWVTK